MRVMLSTRKRSGESNQSGAVAVIVALSLIALIGVTVLVVDVGGLLYRRRQMVSAADAAALAAAQSCALGRTVAGVPETRADELATENVKGLNLAGGIVAAETVGCETDAEGHVTVEYTSEHDLWFAGVFGKSSFTVRTKATAEWGHAGSGWPVPFIVTLSNSGNVYCKNENGDPVDISDTTALGTVCAVWFDNSSSGGYFSGFGESVFGSLNLDKWDVADDFNCGGKDLPDNTHYAYVGGYDGGTALRPLHYPDPTWVCNGDGLSTTLYDVNGLKNSKGKILVFPITDKTVVLDSSGKIDKFNVVGYVALYLVDVLDANETDPTVTACGPYTPTMSPVAPPATPPVGTQHVFDLDLQTCAAGASSLSDPTVTKIGSGPPVNATDYSYDATTHEITWLADERQVSIEFNKLVNSACGQKPSNSSGQCLIVRWEGAQLGNGPLGGNNVGVPAVRLCDVTITGSCDTLT